MSQFKLLVAEDKDDELEACRDSVARFRNDRKREVEIVECKTREKAYQVLDNTFDGAIIDLKLPDTGTEGNDIVKHIAQNHWRIPTVIFTGTPDNADRGFAYVAIYKKGEVSYFDLLDRFARIYDTGLTRILGGRGEIEDVLNSVFTRNILPRLDFWVNYAAASPDKAQRALLRFTLNHLMQILENDGDRFLAEEVYISPPLTAEMKTGSIVKKKGNLESRIVLNPACDLVVRSDGKPKTDRFLLAEIENEIDIREMVLLGIKKAGSRTSRLEDLLKNNYCDYYHWLPKTNDFRGGFINFRKIAAFSSEEINTQFEVPNVEVSHQFVKDIVARFSSYYGRQGQPEIDFKHDLEDLLTDAS